MSALTSSAIGALVLSVASQGAPFFGQPITAKDRFLRLFDPATLEIGDGLPGAAAYPIQPSAELEVTMFNRAAQETDGWRKLVLADEFLRMFPESRYGDAARYVRFLGLRDSGDDNAALAAAQAILTRNPTREDVLFYAAHRYYSEKRELTNVVNYCYIVIAILETRTKPESVDEMQWIEQRDSALFQAHWLMGAAHMLRSEWALADKSLRSALAMTRAAGSNIPAVLSSLAWTNYQMKRIPETIRLYEQCTQAPGYAAACKQSIAYIKNEYALQ
jgi:hypothetical protein